MGLNKTINHLVSPNSPKIATDAGFQPGMYVGAKCHAKRRAELASFHPPLMVAPSGDSVRSVASFAASVGGVLASASIHCPGGESIVGEDGFEDDDVDVSIGEVMAEVDPVIAAAVANALSSAFPFVPCIECVCLVECLRLGNL